MSGNMLMSAGSLSYQSFELMYPEEIPESDYGGFIKESFRESQQEKFIFLGSGKGCPEYPDCKFCPDEKEGDHNGPADQNPVLHGLHFSQYKFT